MTTNGRITVEEAKQLLPLEYQNFSDEKILAIVNFFEKIWYIIIDEEFSSKGL